MTTTNHVPTDDKSNQKAQKAAAKIAKETAKAEAKAAADKVKADEKAAAAMALITEPVLTAQQTVSYRVMNRKDLMVDPSWNTRLERRAAMDVPHPDATSKEKIEIPGLSGLCDSLASKGQDNAVCAAIVQTGPNKGAIWLCDGFRRELACAKLEAEGKSIQGLQPGELHVKVYDGLSDAEMRNLNLRGYAREDAYPSDLAYGIQQQILANPDVTGAEIARTICKTPGYVSQLKDIAFLLLPELFKAWREDPATALAHMKVYAIAKMDRKEQKAAYAEAIEAKKPKEAGDPLAWVDAVMKKAEEMGETFGVAQRLGIIKGFDPESLAVVEHIRDLVNIKATFTKIEDGEKKTKNVSVVTDRKIAKSFIAGFEAGVVEPEEEEEEEKKEK